MPPTQAVRAKIVTAIEPVVAAAGYVLEEVAVNQAGRRTVVRVVVDAEEAEGGVTLDDIASVSRDVSAVLDGTADNSENAEFSALGAGPYTLEVTSPGVDRPLTLPRHWRRNVGRLVTVRAEGRDITARVLAADADAVTLRAEGGKPEGSGKPKGKGKTAKGGPPPTVVLPYADLGHGRVQVEFNRGPTAEPEIEPAEEEER
jgi:ribosome maturation factor RimP